MRLTSKKRDGKGEGNKKGGEGKQLEGDGKKGERRGGEERKCVLLINFAP